MIKHRNEMHMLSEDSQNNPSFVVGVGKSFLVVLLLMVLIRNC